MEGYISEVRLFAPTWAPRNWAFCQGQTMSISQNTALFSLIGTLYGGNGQTTFNLPDLRGRVAVGAGQGPGLSNIPVGQLSGTETNTLTSSNLPAHNHAVNCVNANGNSPTPVNALPAAENVSQADVWSTAAANGQMSPNMIGLTGGSVPVNNREPHLGINYIICLYGIYPSRS